jgi:TonB-dependent siderophore receptor
MQRIVQVAAGIAAASVLIWAQESAAQGLSVSGTVRDNVGVIPDVTVVLSSGGDEVASTTTDGAGTYLFDGLARGGYELAFSREGFETLVRNVTVGPSTPPVDAVLVVGRVSTTLTVTAAGGRATASQLPVPDDDLPVQVSSIPRELLLQQGVNSVADALRNASGVQAVRWYGVYEQYTIRGFNDPNRDSFNVMLLDGMRFNGNRYNTQTNGIESIEVLKGPSSILYGRGAVGGAINIVRKRPQAAPAFELSYRGGSFNTHQIAGGATGALSGNGRVLYRLDGGFETSDGWRDAGADRFNISPTVTFLMGDSARLTVHQTLNRDRFDGDGGVPLNITDHPAYDPELNFRLPQDNVLIEDSQTQVVFTGDLAPIWQVRNSVQYQRTSDRYFVTEGVYGDPDENIVFREPLDFHHIRRPVQNQTEILGRVGGHNLMAGYEFQRDKYRTDVTAGDDPDCLCGYWWLTIPEMNFTTMQETLTTPLDIDTIERRTFVNDRSHAIYLQDQIDLTTQLKVNLGVRHENYTRDVTRTGGLPFSPQHREQTATSYRAGLVYAPRFDQQIYVGSSSSFTPTTTVAPDGTPLEPSTARNLEVGHRWQGLDGRVDTNLAVYHIVRNNLNVRESVTSYIQVGEQRSAGLDVDVNTALGRQASVVFNYGFVSPRFKDTDDLDGLVPRYVPTHTANLWLRSAWASGLNAAFGARYVGEQFANNSNSIRLDSYAIAAAAFGYSTPRWTWSVNIDNLFNKDDYFLPGHFSGIVFPGAPLSATTTLRLRY